MTDWNKLTIYDKYEKAHVKKIGIVDIEVSNLHADFGGCITIVLGVRNVSSKPKDRKLKIYRWYVTQNDIKHALKAGKPIQDKRIIKQFLEKIRKEKIALIITHYGIGWRGLDIPFIRARAMKLGLDDLIPRYRTIRYGDLWSMSHKTIRIHSYRLESVGDINNISGLKTKLDVDIWQLAKVGHRKSIQTILHHNINDVILTWKVHKKMEEFSPVPSTYL